MGRVRQEKRQEERISRTSKRAIAREAFFEYSDHIRDRFFEAARVSEARRDGGIYLEELSVRMRNMTIEEIISLDLKTDLLQAGKARKKTHRKTQKPSPPALEPLGIQLGSVTESPAGRQTPAYAGPAMPPPPIAGRPKLTVNQLAGPSQFETPIFSLYNTQTQLSSVPFGMPATPGTVLANSSPSAANRRTAPSSTPNRPSKRARVTHTHTAVASTHILASQHTYTHTPPAGIYTHTHLSSASQSAWQPYSQPPYSQPPYSQPAWQPTPEGWYGLSEPWHASGQTTTYALEQYTDAYGHDMC